MKALRTVMLGLAMALPVSAQGASPFSDFISPVTNPVRFEDPRPTTEARPIYIYHRIPGDFVTDGGDANIVQLQLRLALSERFALIATKLGYVWLNPDDNVPGFVTKGSGWSNLAFGMKYAIFRDVAENAMATLGLRYEAATGNSDALQGRVFKANGADQRGDGVMNPFLSGMWGTGKLHLMGSTGWRIPIDGVDSTFFDFSVHSDYRVATPIGALYPLVELNWIQVLDGGRRRLPAAAAGEVRPDSDEEGFDFFNLGSMDAGGHGVVTLAAGTRLRVADNIAVGQGRAMAIDIGAAYEWAATGQSDIFDWRVTSDLIFHLL